MTEVCETDRHRDWKQENPFLERMNFSSKHLGEKKSLDKCQAMFKVERNFDLLFRRIWVWLKRFLIIGSRFELAGRI
jgi:hypothetical protein